MLASTIVVILIGAFFLLLVGIDAGIDGEGFFVIVKVGPVRIDVFDAKKKRVGKKKKPKESRDKKATEKPGKEKRPLRKEEITQLIKMGLRALNRLRGKLSIDLILFHYTAASSDPASTATQYGYVGAALGALMPVIDNAFKVRERDIEVNLDFDLETPVISARVIATFQIWEIIYIGAAFGIEFLYMKYKMR